MHRTFPDDFLIGSATSAHQVEGDNSNSDAWINEQVPGTAFHEPSGKAIDHWNRFKEDIELLAGLGLKSYRFSVEWAKVEPEPGVWSQQALDHYRDVCDACIASGMEPVITLHHFTSPAWLMCFGGWRGSETPALFGRYAERVMRHMGDRVNLVVTLNECNIAAVLQDYLKQLIAKGEAGVLERIGDKKPRRAAAERCGVTEDMYCPFSAATDAQGVATVMAAHRSARDAIRRTSPHVQVGFSLSLHQIQARPGAEQHAVEAWQRKFRQWLPLMADDDFIATQTYTRIILNANNLEDVPAGSESTQMKFEFAPEALAAVLRTVASEIDKPILISENGAAVDDDRERVAFIGRALAGVRQCMDEGIKVLGYFYWSSFDNFEWYYGYSKHFGLIAVDRGTMQRTPKESARYLGMIARTRKLPADAQMQAQPDGGRELLALLQEGRQAQRL